MPLTRQEQLLMELGKRDREQGNLTGRGMSLGVNRPRSSSFWGVELAPSPCKPLCWRILLKTCETQT